MDDALDDLKAGRIQFRDKWQFELKTELFPDGDFTKNLQVQEFYFFIPNSLQVNNQTYSKEQFYHDQTNLIRLKTPTYSFKELIDPDNSESPLVRVLMLIDYAPSKANEEQIQDEVKLIGNIFHSALREEIATFVGDLSSLKNEENRKAYSLQILQFCDQLEKFREQFFAVMQKCEQSRSSSILKIDVDYIDEFISNSISDYLLGFLNRLRQKSFPEFEEVDRRFCEIILKEQNYRKEKFTESSPVLDRHPEEYLLYRKALLSKFLLDPLLLKIS